jgi:hypothetical protein
MRGFLSLGWETSEALAVGGCPGAVRLRREHELKVPAFIVAGVVALAVLPAGMASASTSKSFDITFDGYCDGLHLNQPSVGVPGTAYTVDGDQTGCASGGVFGTARPNRNGKYGVTKGIEFIDIPSFSSFTVINKDHTWVHYGLSGNLIYISNSGTWSLGAPVAGRGGVSSYTPRSRPVAPAAITGAKDIVFDGYCDGMHLVSPSAGLGTKGTVDGNRTGCSSEGLMGAKNKVGGQSGAYAVTFDVGFWIQTAIFPDHTWVHYAANNDVIYVLNSGTWSPGTPTVSGGRPSTG